MSVLVACEYSGIVRDAFIERGHTALSCDLLPTESPGPHYQGDVRDLLDRHWDLMVAHPPCTYLANSGVRWLYEKTNRWQGLIDGAVFFRDLLYADVPMIAVENPVMHKWARKIVGRGPDQSIQPYQFGHPESKRTCLWLKNLPLLKPTDDRSEEVMAMTPQERGKVWMAGGSLSDRSKRRSKFFTGIAAAMAEQWEAAWLEHLAA